MLLATNFFCCASMDVGFCWKRKVNEHNLCMWRQSCELFKLLKYKWHQSEDFRQTNWKFACSRSLQPWWFHFYCFPPGVHDLSWVVPFRWVEPTNYRSIYTLGCCRTTSQPCLAAEQAAMFMKPMTPGVPVVISNKNWSASRSLILQYGTLHPPDLQCNWHPVCSTKRDYTQTQLSPPLRGRRRYVHGWRLVGSGPFLFVEGSGRQVMFTRRFTRKKTDLMSWGSHVCLILRPVPCCFVMCIFWILVSQRLLVSPLTPFFVESIWKCLKHQLADCNHDIFCSLCTNRHKVSHFWVLSVPGSFAFLFHGWKQSFLQDSLWEWLLLPLARCDVSPFLDQNALPTAGEKWQWSIESVR